VDSGIRGDYEVPVYYDPMLSKVSVWAGDRDAARRRMIATLGDYVVLGPTTNLPFLADVLRHPAFAAGETHTKFVDEHFSAWQGADGEARVAAVAAALHQALAPQKAGATSQRAALPSPWQTLGAWRLGGG
jgi:acetyl/propionyl-CoA carboxylase alpha subunit